MATEIESLFMLDASSVPGQALASALSWFVPTTAWVPRMSRLAFLRHGRTLASNNTPLASIEFPLQRGYSVSLFERIFDISSLVREKLLENCHRPSHCALLCTSPFWAPLAEQWPGPVLYHSLDYTYAYSGLSPRRVLELEKRLCRAAVLVSAVSRRICDYLIAQANCTPEKILILPNATLAENVRPPINHFAGPLPSVCADMVRPIAGVIGNMAENLDWVLLRDTISQPDHQWSWIFVGPSDSKIVDRKQRRARKDVMQMGSHVRFVGARPYQELQSFARAFDVAVLPYRRREPTYSGSATRFYEHLAACRPILATPNVAELQYKEPLLRLVTKATELAEELDYLRSLNFDDGLVQQRYVASRRETWQVRAQTLLRQLRFHLTTPTLFRSSRQPTI